MKLVYALIADAAQVSLDGKISMIGGDVDTIYAATFPVQHPTMALVLRMDFALSETDKAHSLRIALSGPLQEPIVPPIVNTFTPTRPAGYIRPMVRSMFVLNLTGLVFPQKGRYMFKITVDDKVLTEFPLYLEHHFAPSDKIHG